MPKERNSGHPPQIEALVRLVEKDARAAIYRRPVLTELARLIVAESREHNKDNAIEALAAALLDELCELHENRMQPVVNATGVLLNTNLGRAPIARVAAEAAVLAASAYTSLEYDIEKGKRSDRNNHLQRLFQLLTGCEDCLIVNNNAAAVMLCMHSLAKNKEVIVSRGELVEIGGSFRLPDVIGASGARLREVGTTNRTRLSDYQSAIGEESAILFKCHPANFMISGFTEDVSLKDLARLSRERQLPLVHDLGAGALFALDDLLPRPEPTVGQSLKEGADLVTFSADKLLGAGQAGIIAGRRSLIALLKSNPLYRALRPDKLLVSLLQSVLFDFLKNDWQQSVPIYRLAYQTVAQLETRALAIKSAVDAVWPCRFLSLRSSTATFGGGAGHGQSLQSIALAIDTKNGANYFGSAQHLARKLRLADPPIIAMIDDDNVLLDLRTVLPEQDKQIVKAIVSSKSV